MPYITFCRNQVNYEIDLEIMERIRELQEAVVALQQELGASADVSKVSAAMELQAAHEAAVIEEKETYVAKLAEQALSLGVDVSAVQGSVDAQLSALEAAVATAQLSAAKLSGSSAEADGI